MVAAAATTPSPILSGSSRSALLNTGAAMPLLTFGCFAGGEAEASVVERYLSKPLSRGGAMQPLVPQPEWEVRAEEAVKAAIAAGYRSLDTAFIYGTEPAVGRAIAAKIADGTVRREELFVTSKLTQAHHARRDVEPALRRSLANLGLDYVDLWLVHCPIAYHHDEALGLWPARPDGSRIYDLDTSLAETWRGMEAVARLGLARAVGVSNFSATQLVELVSGGVEVVPAVNQVESHPFCTQEALLCVCRREGVWLSAYSPLGGSSSSISSQPTPAREDQAAAPALDASPQGLKARLLAHPTVCGEPNGCLNEAPCPPCTSHRASIRQPFGAAIAGAHGRTVPQVLLRYQVQRGVVVVAKSFTPARIATVRARSLTPHIEAPWRPNH
jgi:diketogulonate reductase-like aldo/keto reductase